MVKIFILDIKMCFSSFVWFFFLFICFFCYLLLLIWNSKPVFLHFHASFYISFLCIDLSYLPFIYNLSDSVFGVESKSYSKNAILHRFSFQFKLLRTKDSVNETRLLKLEKRKFTRPCRLSLKLWILENSTRRLPQRSSTFEEDFHKQHTTAQLLDHN